MPHRFNSIVFVILILAFAALAADSGTLQGLLVDSETGDAAIGVNVMITGTPLGAAADLDGHFRIVNIPVGTYSVVASGLGYAKLTVQNVVIAADQVQTLNLKLRSEALQMDEVVIEAKEVNNTEAALLSIQKRATSVSDGISAEQMKKSPDSDASGAVKRVTGVTIVNDKYVYVRGMGERYNNTRLNGLSIASPEPLKRTVPFDIIPANLLDNVIVSKTATPDQPGDFAGGSVQLTTREFPEKLTLSASTTSAYNDQSSLKSFNTYSGGNKDWLAIDDGTRGIPDFVENSRWWNDRDMQKQAALDFNQVWQPRSTSAPLSGTRSVALGNQSTVMGKPVGYLFSLNYAGSYSRRQSNQFDYVPVYDSSGTRRYDVTQDLSVDRSVQSVRWGGILDLNTKVSSRHKVGLKTLYTRSSDNEARIAEGWIKVANYRNFRLQWTERSLFTEQLKGEHEFTTLAGSQLNWAGAYSRGTYDQPDRRDLYYRQDNADGLYYFEPIGASGRRRFAKLRDNVYESTVDWTLPLDKFHLPLSRAKVGGLYRKLERSYPTYTYYFSYQTNPDVQQMDRTQPPDALFSEQNIRNNFWLDQLTAALDSYNATMKVAAAYAMGDVMVAKRWRVIGGLRLEATDQHYRTFPYAGSAEADVSEGGPRHTDVLPSLNVTYKVTEQLNLRAAASRTIANPDYAEIVPSEDAEFFEGAVRRGNPDIKHTKIANFDLRADYYPTPGEALSVGLFYKDIKDPIEWVLIGGASQPEMEPNNFATAHNLGAEVDARKSLHGLTPKLGKWISYFSAMGNLTLVNSSVDLTSEGYNILTNRNRPLIEQSSYVLNATLGFDQPKWGSSARLLFNTYGKRISAVGALGFDDTYELPFAKLDFTWNQSVDKHWAIKLQGTNLLDSSIEFESDSYPIQKYSIGRTYSMQLAYTI